MTSLAAALSAIRNRARLRQIIFASLIALFVAGVLIVYATGPLQGFAGIIGSIFVTFAILALIGLTIGCSVWGWELAGDLEEWLTRLIRKRSAHRNWPFE